MHFKLTRIASFLLPLTLAACVPSEEDDGNAEGTGETGSNLGADPCPPATGTLDESSCMVPATDYVPGAEDAFAACISDGGTYELVTGPPGASARIEAFEEIAALLWSDTAPTQDDFTMARIFFSTAEGLESRVERREDLHYPAIPMAEWDPGLESDKQCANEMLAAAYSDRCVGPATMLPLLNQAFIDGIEGNGDPNTNAAIIKGTLLWFIYLSIYKESSSCFTVAGGDCDASWGYFSGGAQLDGELLGLGKIVEQYSPNAAARIFDGLLAVRCVRDLYPEDMFPASPVDPLPAEGQALFDVAWEQLDQALHRGLAIALRQHVAAQDSCGDAAVANWAFVQIVGNALVREAKERDDAAGSELETLVALVDPTPEDTARVIELIDQVFPCP